MIRSYLPALVFLGLGAFRDKFVSELSTGSRRIVDLAVARRISSVAVTR